MRVNPSEIQDIGTELTKALRPGQDGGVGWCGKAGGKVVRVGDSSQICDGDARSHHRQFPSPRAESIPKQ